MSHSRSFDEEHITFHFNSGMDGDVTIYLPTHRVKEETVGLYSFDMAIVKIPGHVLLTFAMEHFTSRAIDMLEQLTWDRVKRLFSYAETITR